MKKLLLLFAFLTLSVGLWAIDNVAYIDADGNSLTANNVTEITTSTTTLSGWCVVNGNVTTGSLTCSGAVHLILADGAKLTATGKDNQAGIQVSSDGNSLTIYGQTAQSGQLEATGGKFAAGIGGAGLYNLNGSNITINGGMVTATGDWGAGIGGGYGGTGSDIIINGGFVTANCGAYGASIGGGNGSDGFDITINGGTVITNGRSGSSGAGIGGGEKGRGYNITINGGIVRASGSYYDNDYEGHVCGDGIGNGAKATTPSSNIFVATTRMVKAGSSANPTEPIAHTGDDDLASVLTGKQYVMVTPPVYYIDEYGEEQAANSASEITSSTDQVTLGTAGKTTWYVVTGADVTLSKAAICKGDVRLILADGAKLTATGSWRSEEPCYAGIHVSGEGNSLAIYGQANKSGQLIANGVQCSAGIGGGLENAGSNITINGGTVTATGDGGAGIGGGSAGGGSNITINGGTVTATGYGGGAGIGGGSAGGGSNITINGGTVTATGHGGGAGIGGGDMGNGYNITINGGVITATSISNYRPTAIGGGDQSSDNSNITIATFLCVKAGSSENPTTEIATNRTDDTDLATELAGKRYVTIEPHKYAVVYGEHVTVSPNFTSGTEIAYGTQVTFTAADRSADNKEFCGFYAENSFETPITTGASGTTYTVTIAVTDAISVYAKYSQHVSYIDEGCISHDVDACVVNSTDTPVTWGKTRETTWYVVTGTDVQLSKGAICQGDVQLILADGATLTATGDNTNKTPGIQVSGALNSLTIHGQTKQTGKIIANGVGSSAGIGGGYQGSGSNITINGGTITANGGDMAAGIGGGFYGSGSNITINGGTVTANGVFAAGIGGGNVGNGSGITINGGTIIANAGENAAAIGGGDRGNGSGITINGGTVTAKGGGYGAGIGGGLMGYGHDIAINGGTVTATGASGADCIGNGKYFETKLESYNITMATTHIVKAGDSENSANVIENTGSDLAKALVGKPYVKIEPMPAINVSYIDVDGEEKTVSAREVKVSNSPVIWGEAFKTSWYVVKGADVQLQKGTVCLGVVNLILADGAKLTSTDTSDRTQAGIGVSGANSLTIYGQTEQSGQLIATGNSWGAAGIGGEFDGSGSNITINGGTVTANGGNGGAGIGGGYRGYGSNITINGGTVTATGYGGGAGIGGGGGTVYGGGNQRYGSNITINGGTVTAIGADGADGIGSGELGSASSNITVASILVVKADGNNPPTTVIENTGGDLAESLAGKRYVTVTDDVCNLTANQDPDHIKNYYSTFYSSKKAYSVPKGVTAYTGMVDGDVLNLTSITDGIIPAGEAVILRLTTEEDNTAATKQQIALTATTTTATKSTNNKLIGTDTPKTLGANDYALSLGQYGVGFYKWEGNPISAHKAYLTLDDSTINAKAFTFMFEDGTTTGIREASPKSSPEGMDLMYDLNGIRMNGNSHKGIVIKNGRKVYRK